MVDPKVLERTEGLHWAKGRFGEKDSVGGKKVGLNWSKIMALKQSLFSPSYSL